MSNNNISGPYSDPNNTPPLGEATALGLQHVLAMFASNVTPSVIVAGGLGAGFKFNGPEMVYLIQMAMLFAGVATLFQTIGFGPVGSRLPIMQGTSFAFVGVLSLTAAGIVKNGGSSEQAMSVVLTACIIGGFIHFLLGGIIKNIRWLFLLMFFDPHRSTSLSIRWLEFFFFCTSWDWA